MGEGISKSKEILQLGGFLNSWFKNRIAKNQNALIAITGPTGSSKTYDALTTAENWYDYNFHKEEFPIDNVCFSLGAIAKRITSLHKENKLRKGELFILEEAGTNFGNLDFQNKLNKMFNYILQSFRSMNLIVLITLPVLTMLNKSARLLIHANFVTVSIDMKKQIAKVKPYFHQLNQHSGKSYWKYPRVKIGSSKVLRLERILFRKPSQRLIDLYEVNKKKYVFELTESLANEAENDDREKMLKVAMERRGLSNQECRIIDMLTQGLTREEIAEKMGCGLGNIKERIRNARKKGYDIDKFIKSGQKLRITIINDNETRANTPTQDIIAPLP
jgi:DNA-binding CsgD family transcriptional regulator